MNTNLTWRVLAGLLLLAWAARAAPGDTASASERRSDPSDARVGEAAVNLGPLASDALRPSERALLTRLLGTSRQQMRLAEIAVSQATNTAVRSHALQLVTDYRTLAESLDALGRRKGGSALAAGESLSEAVRELTAKSGAEFDRAYVRLAGGLGDEALSHVEQLASEAKDEELRALVSSQLPVLRAHRIAITELRKTFE